MDAGHEWVATVHPPALVNPETITLPGTYLGTMSHALCTGPGYLVNLDNAKDYIVRTSEVLTAPVKIYGGRNVRIVGIHIDLATAACASSGVSGYVPGTIALAVYQVGTTFVEGAYIDVAGRSADCIDPRNFIGGFDALSHGYSEADARGARDVVIQNSVCRGMSGDHNVHGDILQTQGGAELFRSITFENVSADSNCEGTVLEPREGFLLADQITLRRFDYQHDSRFTPNVDPYDGRTYDGGPVQHSAKAYSYDQVFIYRAEPPYEFTPPISGWVGSTAYAVGDTVVWGGGKVYRCVVAGTSASTGGPTGTGSNIADGGAQWTYLRPQDSYLVTRPPCNVGGLFCPATASPDRFASPGTGPATSAWTGLNYVSPHQ
ncbi:MAG: hypothetical protein QM765_35545 [Myxococcales bacterium]